MRKRANHIHRILSILLLWVFAIALTPFSAFHNHNHEEPRCSATEKICQHKVHISNHTDTCLVCAAHFEKNYLRTTTRFEIYQVNKPLVKFYPTVKGCYAELISLALRGPPVA